MNHASLPTSSPLRYRVEEIPEEEVRPQTIEEHFEEIDCWVEGEKPLRTFGHYCRLEAENFSTGRTVN